MDIEKKVNDLIEKKVEEAGYKIDEISYVKEDGNKYLRVVITKQGIIDVEDCVTVSNIINPILDDADPIDEYYILDVCSKQKGSE